MDQFRSIRVAGTVKTVPYRQAVSMVSRQLAEFVDAKPRRGRPKGSKNKPKPVSAEAVFAHPDVPIEDSTLPGSVLADDATDNAENKPPSTE